KSLYFLTRLRAEITGSFEVVVCCVTRVNTSRNRCLAHRRVRSRSGQLAYAEGSALCDIAALTSHARRTPDGYTARYHRRPHATTHCRRRRPPCLLRSAAAVPFQTYGGARRRHSAEHRGGGGEPRAAAAREQRHHACRRR